MRIDLCAFADEAADEFGGQIEALKRNGIKRIELRGVNGVNVKDLTAAAAQEIAAELQREGISVWSIGSPIGKSDAFGDFGAVKKDLLHILRLCKIFGCGRIRVFSFFTAEYEKAREEVISRLNELVVIAANQGVILCHENEKDIYGDTAERVKELLRRVKGLKYVYDPANFIAVGENRQNMADMRKSADYYHIKDALYSGELVPAGEGDGDVKLIISELSRDANFTLEPHLAVFSGYAAIDKHELKNKYSFASRGEAFDAAVAALKGLLCECGYRECDGYFVK